MRIGLAHSHPDTFGGGEQALLALARGLGARHQIRLIAPPIDARRTFPSLTSYPRVDVRGLGWLVRQCPDDAIVANSFGANLLSLRNGRRVIYWVHSLRSLFLLPNARRPDLLARRAFDRLSVRRAGRLVANSRFTAERFPSLYGRVADAVVYPGVDLERFPPGDGSGGYAITVGRLSPEKGVDRLLEAWRDLDVPLRVIGSGDTDEVAHLRHLAPSGVTFEGTLDAESLAAAYRGAAVAVFAPRAEEFGIAPLEAMASGVPVVAVREGGLRETVVDGETGFLVSSPEELQDRVRQVAADVALRRRLSAAARARAEQFGWDRTIAAMEALCRDVATTNGPRARARRV